MRRVMMVMMVIMVMMMMMVMIEMMVMMVMMVMMGGVMTGNPASTFMLTALLPCCHLLLSEYTPSSRDALIVIIIILPDVFCSIAVIIILLA